MSPENSINVILAAPNGFCAGVVRAVEIVERALQKYGAPIYVRHEIVHNEYVVDDLRRQGAIFVDELDEVPCGSRVIFSAHGVSKEVQKDAKKRGLFVLDATCPLVTRVHHQVEKLSEEDREIIMIGHLGHPEVEGTMGQIKTLIHLVQNEIDAENVMIQNPEKVSYVTQTTLSVDDTSAIVNVLRQRFPHLEGMTKTDICYATTNRQQAVKVIAQEVDLVIVIGSQRSSNSLRLLECAQKLNINAYLINASQDICATWLMGCSSVGVTAGASTPNALVLQVLARLKELGAGSVRTLQVKEEKATFSLPKELQF